MNDDIKEFKAWFDSHKDEDGSINLDKHPHLLAYMTNFLVPVPLTEKWETLCEQFPELEFCAGKWDFSGIKKH